jgi:trk system potassium uptake protein TrkA
MAGQVGKDPDAYAERHDAHEREWEAQGPKSYKSGLSRLARGQGPKQCLPIISALKLLIVGCGRVGSQLASDMDKAGHEVVIIDRDPNQFSRAASRGVLTNDFKGNQVVGNGTDADVLRRAGVEDADGFVAVTEGDNRNIMASQIAKHIFKVPRVVARIYDPERADAYEKLGLHTLCPTIEGAKAIEKTLLEKR